MVDFAANVKLLILGDGSYMSFYSRLAIATLLLIYGTDPHWTPLDPGFFALSIVIILLSRITTDASSKGEKVFYLLFLVTVCCTNFVLNLVADHKCTDCMLSLPELVKQYVLPEPGQERMDAWRLFTDEKNSPQICASCVIDVATYFKWIVPEEFAVMSDEIQHDAGSDDEEVCVAEEHCPAVEDPLALSPAELREMDEWYLKVRESSAPKDAFKKFVRALASNVNSARGNELLANMTHDFLCYPTSRLNGPKPSEYLQNLRVPRFTGEEVHPGDGPMKIDFQKLVAIMRGDKMRRLPPDVCGMIRLTSMLAVDETVLVSGMSAANVAPIGNETALRGHNIALLFPGGYIPQGDEDKDPDGSVSTVTTTLITLYKRLPIVDDNIQFETREEYIAFFRWLIEHKVQDEHYFPKWLSRIDETGDAESLVMEVGDLLSDQFRYRGDRQRILDSTSDVTLADRAFYGAGVKSLTRIVLPGDPSYGYLVPSETYATPAEREFFRNDAMPTEQDLLRMATVAWSRSVKDLEELRDKVVQIDYTLVSHWQYREAFEQNGAILYLDAETRTPMGIWVSCREQLVLRTGALWELAKFIYRSTEVMIAAMIHVADYHLGWANRFNLAIRQTLPPTHGLRVLMKPYIHGTGSVNWNAYQMLVLDDSILARACGLTNRHRGFSWGHITKHSDMVSTLPHTLAAKKLDGISNLTTTLPYFTQGTRLWDIHHEYVEAFVNLLYEDDERLFGDDALYRFWQHINSVGRHIDPCVCDMDETAFYKKNHWPAFESTRTCAGLLDHAEFHSDDTDQKKRRGVWCKQTLPNERTKALYQWLESECEESSVCTHVSYEVEHMRADMGLPELSRESLVNLITRFIYEVTAGHEMMADNLPFIVDPSYGGVRRLKDYDEAQAPVADLSTYIFGCVISALTTIRSMPLLSDWSGLLESWVDNKADWRRLSDADRAARKETLRNMHLDYKAKLISNANLFLKETLQRPQNQWSPFLNPNVQATSIAV